jgi:hypothetical protein
MNVFKVPDSLEGKYHGTGHALAATVDGQLVDIVYLADVLPDFDGNIEAAMTDDRLAPTVRKLQSLGSVHAGMLSCWEFCELLMNKATGQLFAGFDADNHPLG